MMMKCLFIYGFQVLCLGILTLGFEEHQADDEVRPTEGSGVNGLGYTMAAAAFFGFIGLLVELFHWWRPDPVPLPPQ